jgi:hypothetical protein
MFKEIKSIIGEFKPSLQVINDIKGNTLTEKKDILDRWTEYCRAMYADTSKNPDMITESKDKEPEPILDEVCSAIKNLKRGKSPGCDDIPPEFIQAGGVASA